MKLIDDLKEKVENSKTKEEARDTIKEAGKLLDDEELDKVSGGGNLLRIILMTGQGKTGQRKVSSGQGKIFRPDTGELFTRSVCHDPDTFGECDHANSRNHPDIHCSYTDQQHHEHFFVTPNSSEQNCCIR